MHDDEQLARKDVQAAEQTLRTMESFGVEVEQEMTEALLDSMSEMGRVAEIGRFIQREEGTGEQ